MTFQKNLKFGPYGAVTQFATQFTTQFTPVFWKYIAKNKKRKKINLGKNVLRIWSLIGQNMT